ncbi:MAG: choice-of-anchor tandem repeat GloVer-containing protein [Candidatus Korobacteraceae bacterium]
MAIQLKSTASNSRIDVRATALVFLAVLATMLTLHPGAHAQTYTVLHTFTGGADGRSPLDGLSMDRAGNLYGTTSVGGDIQGGCAEFSGCGVVFKMKQTGSSWLLLPLYAFTGSPDGRYPVGRVVLGPDGALYGTTVYGGQASQDQEEGCGILYRLSPPPTSPHSAIFSWSETILYTPTGEGGDGCGLTDFGGLTFDASGDLYGTASGGGASDVGTVFELTHSGDQWTQSTIHSFVRGYDGAYPAAGATLDQSGNLFGTTELFPGSVYQLSPSQSGWTVSVLRFFNGQDGGTEPVGGVIFDSSGNLYGTTVGGGTGYGGVVFQLAPSGGSWTFNLLYSFIGEAGPSSDLLLDSAGNLYGTTYKDGRFGVGNVFKLSPSGDGWTYTSLYDFHGTGDGGFPQSNLIMDAAGNLYGTTTLGGNLNDCPSGCGVVFEITP